MCATADCELSLGFTIHLFRYANGGTTDLADALDPRPVFANQGTNNFVGKVEGGADARQAGPAVRTTISGGVSAAGDLITGGYYGGKVLDETPGNHP